MNRVHDLPGDWFAVRWCPCGGTNQGSVHGYRCVFCNNPLPAVGDVLANTRTEWNTEDRGGGYAETIVLGEAWSDPPFVRVVEARQFTKDEQWRPGVVIWSHFHQTWVIPATGEHDAVIVGDLPGAQPGGWAVRVEAVPPPDEGSCVAEQHCWHWYECEPCCRCGDDAIDLTCDCDKHAAMRQPPTGRPLNEQEDTR